MFISRRRFLQSSSSASLITLFPGFCMAASEPGLSSALMDDAASAWQFFKQPGDLAPGILPSTAWREGEGFGQHGVLTMWDVGSLILGYVSARRLELIDQADFDARIDGVIQFIEKARFSHDGENLLNFRNSAKDASSVEDGFDSTDTGRLLIANTGPRVRVI